MASTQVPELLLSLSITYITSTLPPAPSRKGIDDPVAMLGSYIRRSMEAYP